MHKFQGSASRKSRRYSRQFSSQFESLDVSRLRRLESVESRREVASRPRTRQEKLVSFQKTPSGASTPGQKSHSVNKPTVAPLRRGDFHVSFDVSTREHWLRESNSQPLAWHSEGIPLRHGGYIFIQLTHIKKQGFCVL